ncbi:metallophosphoesterase [Paenibacillus daejeonensis]|uniref:metallophosphoesterase n=1 Tax=Paenibacillus daejeonensis TaxID=135193 RepID=UPI0003791923|nr:metallophosphoesterase [Paenibacillus daejeonensis]
MKPISRREFIKLAAGGILTAGLGTPLYAHLVERRWLRTDQVTLSFDDLPADLQSFRILHFSDVHLGYHYGVRDLERLVENINEHTYDMLCFTGDLIENAPDLLEASIPILSRLNAPYGKVAVLGNHDYWQAPDEVADALSQAGFQVLRNDAHRIQVGDATVAFVGLEDAMHAVPDIQAAMAATQPDDFIIVLVHEPDYADVYADDSSLVRLQLSGHSHGGQIRLPLIGHLITPPLGSRYVDRVNHQRGLTIYTNRGVGTTGVPFRLFCRPELSRIQLAQQR